MTEPETVSEFKEHVLRTTSDAQKMSEALLDFVAQYIRANKPTQEAVILALADMLCFAALSVGADLDDITYAVTETYRQQKSCRSERMDKNVN